MGLRLPHILVGKATTFKSIVLFLFEVEKLRTFQGFDITWLEEVLIPKVSMAENKVAVNTVLRSLRASESGAIDVEKTSRC
jgi:hypothetical protein